jgi:hypothetical protein
MPARRAFRTRRHCRPIRPCPGSRSPSGHDRDLPPGRGTVPLRQARASRAAAVTGRVVPWNPVSCTLRPGAWPTMRRRADRAAPAPPGRGGRGAGWPAQSAHLRGYRASSSGKGFPAWLLTAGCPCSGRIGYFALPVHPRETASARVMRQLTADRISSTAGTPRTPSASATSERWQRQGTASAHMMAVRSLPLAWRQSSTSSGVAKRSGLHVVRVAAEALVPPAGVGRILARMPQATQRRHRDDSRWTRPLPGLSARASLLNCGLCRDRGTVRMSASRIRCHRPCSKATKSVRSAGSNARR